MVADEDSKNYMGAVITHNTEHSKKPKHLIEVYYSTVFWCQPVTKKECQKRNINYFRSDILSILGSLDAINPSAYSTPVNLPKSLALYSILSKKFLVEIGVS